MQLSTSDFSRLAGLIEGHCGIKLPIGKKLMVEGRLQRRVRALGLPDLAAYCRLVLDEGGLDTELVNLIDVVTTNKTDFFREPNHFDFLLQHAVPELAQGGAGTERPLYVWSAACSTGQEPYTLAMVLAEAATVYRGLQFQIRATDISTEVLGTALRGVYSQEVAEPIPPALRTRYLMRARDRSRDLVRVVPELREKVRYRRLNLLEAAYPWPDPTDITFCRNVLIYFDRRAQQQALSFLCDHLRPGGYLFVGHSETLNGLSLPVRTVAPAIYQRI